MGDDRLRDAGPDDTVAGVPARHVATPADAAEVAAVLREAGDRTVVVRGAGTRLDWGAPPRGLDLVLDTGRLTGVVEHAAGDLIVVVRAGTPMAELAAELAPAGQQLALDTPEPASTVGGTVATAASGPRRMLYGSVRDLLIGVTVVRADGTVAKAGGKVVKNVAGYDLGKLFTGSFGTLGVITECAFRLHPLPRASAYVSRTVDSVADAGRAVAAVLGAQVVPSALEVATGPGTGVDVAVLLEGVPDGVAQRAAEACRLLGDGATVADGPPPGWTGYPWPPGGVGLKLTAALSGVPAVVAAAREVGCTVRGSAGVGVLYAGLPADADVETVARAVAELRMATAAAGGHAVVLTAAPAVRDAVDLWGPVDGLDLMRRVKDQFDPDGRLAPGRFVGGI